MIRLATVQADDADRTATRDRQTAADLVLGMAVRDAIDYLRDGRPGYAEYRLTRALHSAQRILGEQVRPS